MDVLPGVLGSRTLRRTVQVRLGFDFGFWISDLGFLSTVNDIELTVQMSRFVLRFSQAFQQIFIPQSAFRNPHSSTRWQAHFHGLATSIRELSRLVLAPQVFVRSIEHWVSVHRDKILEKLTLFIRDFDEA